MELGYDKLEYTPTWIAGKTSTGKTVTLLNIALENIEQGMLFIDPRGDATQQFLSRIPKERWSDVIVIDPTDMKHPVAFNILKDIREDCNL